MNNEQKILGRVRTTLSEAYTSKSILTENGKGDCSTNMEYMVILFSYLKEKKVNTKPKLNDLFTGKDTFGIETVVIPNPRVKDNVKFMIDYVTKCVGVNSSNGNMTPIIEMVYSAIKSENIPSKQLEGMGKVYTETSAAWKKYGGISKAPAKTDVISTDATLKFSMKDANRARGLDYMRGNLIALAECAIDKAGKRKAWESEIRKQLNTLMDMEDPSLSRLDPAEKEKYNAEKENVRAKRDAELKKVKGDKKATDKIKKKYSEMLKKIDSKYKWDAADLRKAYDADLISKPYREEYEKFEADTKKLQDTWRSTWENMCKDTNWAVEFWYEALSGEIMFGKQSPSAAKDVLSVSKDFKTVQNTPLRQMAIKLASGGCSTIPTFGTKGAGFKIFLTAKVQIDQAGKVKEHLDELDALLRLESRIEDGLAKNKLDEGFFDTAIEKMGVGFDYISDKSERVLKYIGDKASSILDAIVKMWDAIREGVRELYNRVESMLNQSEPFHTIFSEFGIIVEEPLV